MTDMQKATNKGSGNISQVNGDQMILCDSPVLAIENLNISLSYTEGVDKIHLNLDEYIEKVRGENFRAHFINAKISEPISDCNTEKAKLAKEWIEPVSDIPISDEILSSIWEQWYKEMLSSNDTSNYKVILSIMKEMTAEDARFLLWINGLKKYSPDFSNPTKKTYLIKRLKNWELIYVGKSRLKILIILVFIFVVTPIIFISNKSSETMDILMDNYAFFFGLLFVLAVILGGIILKMTDVWHLSTLKPTWIGKHIISFAKRDKVSDENTQEDQPH